MRKTYDTMILGCGEAGVFAGYELIRRNPGMKVLIVDQGQDIYHRSCPIVAGKVRECIDCKVCHTMCGFGGAFMSMYYAAGWSLDMVAGRGFIALAAQAMGGGECLGGMLSSLVFGFAQALGIKFSAVGLDSNLASPIPYAVTIIGLVIFSLVRRSRAKKLHSAAALK